MVIGRKARPIRVAVIGAGFGGVAAATYLMRNGFTDFRVYERATGAGGVWFQNTYPGAEVDTFSDWYSYKFKKYDWPKPHSPQQVLEGYINEAIDDLGMRDHFEFGVAVERIAWNEESASYRADLSNGHTEIFDVVVSAIGLFNTPNYPKWSQDLAFRGPAFHASRWDHKQDLAGKRVAVVGSGSTGAQIVTAIAETVGQLYVFQRDPTWVLQKNDEWYSEAERRRRRNGLRYTWGRLRHAYAEQRRFFSGKLLIEGSSKNKAESEAALAYIDRVFGDDPDLRKAVTPTHPFFAKRNIKADGYYETLLRENVTFVRSEVVDTSPSAVIDAEGRMYEVDVVVMATGYEAADYLKEIDVVGRGGRRLHDYWDSVGGPEAFLGMSVPGYPNFYMLYGPNTNIGQIVFDLETQSRYVVRNLRWMRRSGIRALEVRAGAHRRYNDWLQSRLKGTIWTTTTNYHKSSTGKLVVPFPIASSQYWAMTRLFRRLAHRAVDQRCRS